MNCSGLYSADCGIAEVLAADTTKYQISKPNFIFQFSY